MRVLLSILPTVVVLTLGLTSCKRAAKVPPPPRSITISVSSGAAPVKELTGRVVVVPYAEGREKLFQAMLKRRKTEETLRKEEAELENALPANIDGTVVAQPAQDQGLERFVGAAKRTIESLADRALIYYDEVAAQKGGELPPERLAAFREKLGVDELKRASSGIKADDPSGTRTAVQTILSVLKREVYTAERMNLERARTETVLNQLTEELEKSPATGKLPGTAARGKVPSGSEALMRYMNNRATHRQTTDPLAMFTALPSTKLTAETDNDGKCTVTIPAEGRWIVGVCFQRPGTDILSRNFGISESFCWIEEIPADRNQLVFNSDKLMKPNVAPLGLEQSVPWR